jgi:hypothetical protein
MNPGLLERASQIALATRHLSFYRRHTSTIRSKHRQARFHGQKGTCHVARESAVSEDC